MSNPMASHLATPRNLLFFAVVTAIAVYVLWDHGGHVLSALPYLLILACPVMHLFMHHGHGHGSQQGHDHANDQPGETRNDRSHHP